MKRYYIRLDRGTGSAAPGAIFEVAVDETAAGLRAAIVRRGEDSPAPAPQPAAGGADGIDAWHRIDLAELVPGWYSVIIDGRSHALGIAAWRAGAAGSAQGGSRRWTLLLDGEAVGVEVGRAARGRTTGQGAAPAAAGQVRAPMPGLVVAIQAAPGTIVASGQPLIIMEAMKMQMEIRAPHAGVVREVRVVPGQDVAGDDVLATVE
ncbi:MAG TPA: biotin/lipoyl-containing protein [bacterium]|nr:biotin/lipoyl-containing protein [bacterium]